MNSTRVILALARASAQEEMAYRTNFLVGLLHSLLNLVTGVAGLAVVFGQVETLRGWDFAEALALLGVYLLASALRALFIGPSLDALAGMDGAIWQGTFDFTLLRPRSPQFLVSFQRWRLFALVDLLLAGGVLAAALARLGQTLTLSQALGFLVALAAALAILYSLLLGLTSLVFWGPGFLYTWLFDAVFQMARYPVGLYPGWMRLVLTWVLPVGLITTVPARVVTGAGTPALLLATVAFAAALFVGASWLFHRALRRYASASS